MENRDIIFVSNGLANGGAARVICLLANFFSTSGRKVGVISFAPYNDEFRLDQDVKKEYGPAAKGLYSKLRRILWIRKLVGANPKASIIAFEYFVNVQVLIASTGLPNNVVVSERNDPARVGSGFPRDLIRKAMYRNAHALVCQTSDAAEYFSKVANKRVILNPLSPDLPEPFVGERRPVIVTFCRLEQQKNLGMLIRAFATFSEKHPEYSLEIFGDGRERAALQVLVDSLSLSGSVAIKASRSDVHHLVRDCAMFVLPSNYEGLSNSMLEALALGLPTICTDAPCGGAKTVIRDGENGLLVPVRGEQALVEAMDRVASDEGLAKELSMNGRAIRDELSIEAISGEWHELLRSS